MAKSKPSKLSMNSKKNQSKKSISAAAKGKTQLKKPAVTASKSKAKNTAAVKSAVKSVGKPVAKSAVKQVAKLAKSIPKSSSKSSARAPAQKTNVTPIRAQARPSPAAKKLGSIVRGSGAAKAKSGKVIPLRASARELTVAAKSQAKKLPANSKSNVKANMQDVFSPLDDRVLVERKGVAERTAGGLFIPDMVTERPNEGTVLAVGRGGRDKKGRLRPLDVRVGDKVMFTKWAGSDCSISEKELVILHESDIYGIVSQHSLR